MSQSGIVNALGIIPSDVITGSVTPDAVVIGGATSTEITSIALGLTGQVLAGDTGNPPFWDNNLDINDNINMLNPTSADGSMGTINQAGSVLLSTWPGDGSIFVGQDSGNTTNTGSFNTSLGFSSMLSIMADTNCVAIGYDAQRNSSSNIDCVAVGYASQSSMSSSGQSIAVGSNSMQNGSTMGSCVAIGYYAQSDSTGFTDCIAIGTETQELGVNNVSCIAMGQQAQNSSSSSQDCIAIGFQAQTNASLNSNGIAIGRLSQSSLNSTTNNTSVGYYTLANAGSGNSNSCFGSGALANLNGGSNNIAIGFNAGDAYGGAETDNIMIGHPGESGESNVTRLGWANVQTSCYIAGISNYNIPTANGSLLVGIDSSSLDTCVLGVVEAISTAPPASQSSSLVLGTAYKNTLGYDVMLVVYVQVTAASGAAILVGVGPTSTPTQQTIDFFSIAIPIVSIPIYLPNGYYALLSTSGSITASISGQMAMAI